MRLSRPDYWNVWWTLTVISAAFTIVVLILETLGVFHDVGLVLSALGLLLTLIFGFMASTRSSLMELKSDVLPRFDRLEQRLDGMGERLDGMSQRGDGTNQRLDGLTVRFDEMSQRLDGTNERLDRVIALLDERLPRSAA